MLYEQYVDQCRKLHKNDNVIYDHLKDEDFDFLLKNNKAIKFVDKEYGIFYRRPVSHLTSKNTIHPVRFGKEKSKTRKGNTKLKTTEEFIKECEEKSPVKYDYSKTIYTDSHTPVIVTYQTYGDFKVHPQVLTNGGIPSKLKKLLKIPFKNKRTVEQCIELARSVHGDTCDYSKFTVYENCDAKITVIDKTFGEYQITFYDHYNLKLGHPNRREKSKYDIDHIIPLSIIVSNNRKAKWSKDRPLFKFLNSNINMRKIKREENLNKSDKVAINGVEVLASSIRNMYDAIYYLIKQELNYDAAKVIEEDKKFMKERLGL